MVNKEQAEALAGDLRGVVPAHWGVEERNTEIRPGKPGRYKVVAWAAGMAIIALPETGKFVVTVDCGPGVVKGFTARTPGGKKDFATAVEAYAGLAEFVRDRHRRVTRQIAALESCPSPPAPAGTPLVRR